MKIPVALPERQKQQVEGQLISKANFETKNIFCPEIKILNTGSHDISQKVRQTKLKAKMYNYTKKTPFATWQFDKIGVLVNLIIQKWKSKHLVCLSL